jgi:Sec-independent protein secretion pathway component TatC
MGLVFELPIPHLLSCEARDRDPGLLMRHFRVAVIVMTIIAAVITPTGDMLTR